MQETYNNIRDLVTKKRILLSKIYCSAELSRNDLLKMCEDTNKSKTQEEMNEGMDKWLKIWGKKLKAADSNSPLLKELEELTSIRL